MLVIFPGLDLCRDRTVLLREQLEPTGHSILEKLFRVVCFAEFCTLSRIQIKTDNIFQFACQKWRDEVHDSVEREASLSMFWSPSNDGVNVR